MFTELFLNQALDMLWVMVGSYFIIAGAEAASMNKIVQ